jgi:hypothetical protein
MGVLRRDCEPHRGGLLLALAVVALVCGFAAFFLVVPVVVAVPLGLVVARRARLDLAEMFAGRRDPAGRRQTALARTWAAAGAGLGCLFFWVPLAVVYFLTHLD